MLRKKLHIFSIDFGMINEEGNPLEVDKIVKNIKRFEGNCLKIVFLNKNLSSLFSKHWQIAESSQRLILDILPFFSLNFCKLGLSPFSREFGTDTLVIAELLFSN